MAMVRFALQLSVSLLLVVLAAFGCSNSVTSTPSTQPEPASHSLSAGVFRISSQEFTETRPRVRIPAQYTCMGEDISPPLEWDGAPDGTDSLALLIDNKEHKTGLFNHWVLFNIPPNAKSLEKGIPTTTTILPDGSKQGMNDFKRMGYAGPCPPPNLLKDLYSYYDGKTEAFTFTLYALNSAIDLSPGVTRQEFLKAIDGKILAETYTVGKYLRPKQQGWYLDSSNTAIPNTPTPLRTPFVPPTVSSR